MDEMPKAFLSVLSGDAAAMARFSGLSEDEKEFILSRARVASTQKELNELISRL